MSLTDAHKARVRPQTPRGAAAATPPCRIGHRFRPPLHERASALCLPLPTGLIICAVFLPPLAGAGVAGAGLEGDTCALMVWGATLDAVPDVLLTCCA